MRQVLGGTLVVILMSVGQASSESSFEELRLHELCTSILFSVAPAVRFHDVAQPVSAGHKCSEKAVSTIKFLCARHHCHHHILAECVRRECLHLPPFFALPFALFPPCLLSLSKCLVVFLSSVQERCPKLLLTPESSNKICARTCAQRQLLQ